MLEADSAGVPRTGARWGRPFFLVDRAWTRFETAVACVAVALEVLSMSVWVLLKGFSTPAENESHGGIIVRALLLAFVLGMGGHQAARSASPRVRNGVAIAGVVVGLCLGRPTAALGVDYASNLLNWLQQGCVLTLLGGLRGVGTRLTVLLALVGGSLATARGKHVVLDIATRFARGRLRIGFTSAAWAVSAAVAGAASWGFFDHIAIETFGARANGTAREKLGAVVRQLDEDAFVTRKQLALDIWSFPHVVLRAEGYSDWLTGSAWNRWVAESGFRERYGDEATRGLEIPPGDTRAPLVVVPGRGEPRGELIRDANLVFPIGLLVIAARFVLRSILLLSGYVGADAEEEPFENQPAAAGAGE